MRESTVCLPHGAQQYSASSTKKRKSGVVTAGTNQQVNKQRRYTDVMVRLVKTVSLLLAPPNPL